MDFTRLETWVGLASIIGVGLVAWQVRGERTARRERERCQDQDAGRKEAESAQLRVDLDRAHEKIRRLEETQQADHEMLIEIRADLKYLVASVDAIKGA